MNLYSIEEKENKTVTIPTLKTKGLTATALDYFPFIRDLAFVPMAVIHDSKEYETRKKEMLQSISVSSLSLSAENKMNYMVSDHTKFTNMFTKNIKEHGLILIDEKQNDESLSDKELSKLIDLISSDQAFSFLMPCVKEIDLTFSEEHSRAFFLTNFEPTTPTLIAYILNKSKAFKKVSDVNLARKIVDILINIAPSLNEITLTNTTATIRDVLGELYFICLEEKLTDLHGDAAFLPLIYNAIIFYPVDDCDNLIEYINSVHSAKVASYLNGFYNKSLKDFNNGHCLRTIHLLSSVKIGSRPKLFEMLYNLGHNAPSPLAETLLGSALLNIESVKDKTYFLFSGNLTALPYVESWLYRILEKHLLMIGYEYQEEKPVFDYTENNHKLTTSFMYNDKTLYEAIVHFFPDELSNMCHLEQALKHSAYKVVQSISDKDAIYTHFDKNKLSWHSIRYNEGDKKSPSIVFDSIKEKDVISSMKAEDFLSLISSANTSAIQIIKDINAFYNDKFLSEKNIYLDSMEDIDSLLEKLSIPPLEIMERFTLSPSIKKYLLSII